MADFSLTYSLLSSPPQIGQYAVFARPTGMVFLKEWHFGQITKVCLARACTQLEYQPTLIGSCV
jgi:hypothetical protein